MDTTNPSEASAAPLQPFSFKNAFTAGWNTFTTSYPTLLAVSGILAVIAAVEFVLGLLSQGVLGFDLVGFVAAIFLDPLMYAGALWVGVQFARKRRPQVAEMFEAFSRYWAIVLIALLIAVGIWVSIAILAVPAVSMILAGSRSSGAVLVIVMLCFAFLIFFTSLFVATRVGFAVLICIDDLGPRPGVLDCIRRSWKLTSESWPALILLIFVLVIIVALSILMCILPAVFFGLPMLFAVWGAAYAQLTAQSGMLIHAGPVERCFECGYDLAGYEGARCPECGTMIPTTE